MICSNKQRLLQRQETGSGGEAIIAEHLIQQGYTIHARNYRYSGGEVDIIASQYDSMVFVEVKTRRTRYLEHLSVVVTLEKQRKIIRTAQHYLLHHCVYNSIIRFDVALVQQDGEKHTITYFANAFTMPENS